LFIRIVTCVVVATAGKIGFVVTHFDLIKYQLTASSLPEILIVNRPFIG
jgi:hypothetical protein